MTEKVQRLVMHAFRGVPGEMTVDFGRGDSIAVYGDNGTGKSTIADALEWFFTGEIEFLSHEGRQHAVRHVAGATSGATSVEVLTRYARRHSVPTSARLTRSSPFGGTFLLRGRTLADFINKTKTEKWKALVQILGLDAIESLREDVQKARNELRKESKSAGEQVQVYRRALASEGEEATHESVLTSLQQICRMLGVDAPGCTGSSGGSCLAHSSGRRQRSRFRAIRPREPCVRPPDADGARSRPERPRRLEYSRLVEAGAASTARLAGPGSETARRRSLDQRTLPSLWPTGGRKGARAEYRERARRRDGGVPDSSASAIRSPSGRPSSAPATTDDWLSAIARARRRLSYRRFRRFRSGAFRSARLARSRRRHADHGYLSELRKWDQAAGRVGQKASSSGAGPRFPAHHAGRALPAGQDVAAGGEESGAGAPRVHSRGPRLRCVSGEAEGRPGGALETNQPPRRPRVRRAPPRRGSR